MSAVNDTFRVLRHDGDRGATETIVQALAQAARALPLPRGAKLAFARVSTCDLEVLPAAAADWAERRRNSFAAGRTAAGRALVDSGYKGGGFLGMAPGGLPDWPPGWIGSISHAEAAACAVAMPGKVNGDMVIGLDLERMVEPGTAAEIASSIIPEGVWGSPGLPLAKEVTCVFSAKEALFKALFPQTRQFRGFEAARVSGRRAMADGVVELQLILTEDWGPNWPEGSRLTAFQTVVADHVLTVVWR